MEFEIGQVWEHRFMAGSEALSTSRSSHQSRRGMITGIEEVNGSPSRLYFSIPMVPGRKTGMVHANEFASMPNTRLVGVVAVGEPPVGS